MLSTLSWPSVPLHLGRKAHIKAQQDFLPQMPRTVTVHAQSLGSAAAHTFAYSISTSYSYDKSRPSQPQVAQNTVRSSMAHSAPSAMHKQSASLTANLVAEHTAHERKNEMNTRSFKIYANSKVPNTFVYERSEGSRSDTLTSYSSASSDSFASSSTGTSTTMSQSNFTPRAIKAAPPPSVQAPPRSSNLSARPISSIGNPSTTLRDERRISVIDPPPSARPDSVVRSVPESTLQFPTGQQARDGYSSDSAVMNLGGSRDRTTARPGSSLSAREITPPRIDEQRPDVSRARRLSGAAFAPPPGAIRERYSPDNINALGRTESVRSAVPTTHVPINIAHRNAPPVDRIYVPPGQDRERLRESPPMTVEQSRHRRLSNASVHVPIVTYPVDRPPLSRGPTMSSMNRERTSPTTPYTPDDILRDRQQHQTPLIDSRPYPDNSGRSLADHRGRSPPGNIIITNGAEMIQPSRSVRFSENLICPSPVPPSKRRKGWFNKRGDQLWTNDGQFSLAEQEYPPDLDEYPDFGVGWMNEEGIRIDIHHRLIPKGPLRPALKRTSTSSSSGGSNSSSLRPESRAIYVSSTIRAIDE